MASPVRIVSGGKNVDVSSANPLAIKPILIDEYGNLSHYLCDNIFKGVPIVVDVAHHEIHCGDSYETSYIEDLGNAGVLDLLIVVPAEGIISSLEEGSQQGVRQYHFKGTVTAEAEATLEFFEGVTTSALGSSLPVFNRNRNSERTNFLGVYAAPTITNTDTRLVVAKIGSGRDMGGTATRSDEFILKDGSTYLLRVTNSLTTNNFIGLNIDYYVHPGV